MALVRAFSIGLFSILFASVAWAGSVTPELARKIAQGQVRQHIALFGDWNGASTPTISDHETISLDRGHSAHHFSIHPTGYVIVSAYDMLSPVPFYSTKSTLDVRRAGNPNAIESWILSHLSAKAEAAVNFQSRRAALANDAGLTTNNGRIGNAWAYFDRLGTGEATQTPGRSLSEQATGDSPQIIRGANVAPLLTTAWGQEAPYNIEMPDNDCNSGKTLTGCVATAWAQILKYWQWPPQSLGGQDSHGYTWTSKTGGVHLSVDFTNTEAYDWANMPDNFEAPGATQVQKTAVSKLMYYLAVSAEMNFDCPESAGGSGSELWGDQVLDTYFRYQPMNDTKNRLERENYTAAQWIALITKELDADPPRPIIFSMGAQGGGWHEVVIDGYQQASPLDKVHVNFGWAGSEDAYYDITDDNDFNTSGNNWAVDNDQVIVVGILPDNDPPQVQAGIDTHTEEGAAVTLSASATDPEGVGVSRYLWTQISGPSASIADAESASPTITPPDVHATSVLVFQVKAYDANRAFNTDTCTVTVNNTDASAPPPSGGGGGGCFLDSLGG